MLRINLLDDVLDTRSSREGSGLLVVVALLVIALCGFIGLAGWLTTDAALQRAQAALSEATASGSTAPGSAAPGLAAPAPAVVEADLAPLEALEADAIALANAAQRQALRTAALQHTLTQLDFGTAREDKFALEQLRFDGHQLRAAGVARDQAVLDDLRDALADHAGLRDSRIEVLGEADAPPSGRAARRAPPALRFELHTELSAPAPAAEN